MLVALTLTMSSNSVFATTNTSTNISDQNSGQILDNTTVESSAVTETTAQAAGSPTDNTSFTTEQINVAAAKVKAYTDNHQTLPNYVTIGDIQVTMPQFLKLMVQNIININNGINGSVTLETFDDPKYTNSTETVTSGNLTSSEYITLANQINTYINKYSITTSSATTTLGKINFNNLVYTFSKILTFINTYDQLPNYVSITTWSNIINSSEGSSSEGSSTSSDISFTSDQINNAAYKVKVFTEKYSRLPGYVIIGDTQVTMPQFLKLMVQNIININNGISTSVTLETFDDPKYTNSTETVTSGNLTSSDYVTLAKQINSYINKYGITTSSATTTLGKINFNNLVYTFSKILDFANTNDRLPNYVSVTAWSSVSSSDSSSTSSALAEYLVATTNAPSTNSTIVSLANSITSGLTSTYAKAKAIFDWVNDNLTYSYYYNSQKGALGALSSGTANCCDTANLVVALARAAGIPARYQHGYCNFSSGWYGHVWAQLYVNGTWYYADAISSSNSFGTINNWDLSTYTLYNTYAELPF